MKIEQPPLYPEVRVIPHFTDDVEHNRKEYEACVALVAELGGGTVYIPEGGPWLIAKREHPRANSGTTSP